MSLGWRYLKATTAKAAETRDAGKALASSDVATNMSKLRELGGIGVKLRGRVNPSTRAPLDVVVQDMIVDAPASQSALQIGDVIVSVNDCAVADGATANDVASLLYGPLDQVVTLKVRRHESLHEIVVRRALLATGAAHLFVSQVM